MQLMVYYLLLLKYNQFVDDLEEDADVVQPLYDFVLKHIDWGEDEMVQKYLENIE